MFKKSKKDQNLKYKVRLVNTSTYEVIDDFVDDMVFETFDEAEDYALFGALAEDLRSKVACQIAWRHCSKEVGEESGYTGVFATETGYWEH